MSRLRCLLTFLLSQCIFLRPCANPMHAAWHKMSYFFWRALAVRNAFEIDPTRSAISVSGTCSDAQGVQFNLHLGFIGRDDREQRRETLGRYKWSRAA